MLAPIRRGDSYRFRASADLPSHIGSHGPAPGGNSKLGQTGARRQWQELPPRGQGRHQTIVSVVCEGLRGGGGVPMGETFIGERPKTSRFVRIR